MKTLIKTICVIIGCAMLFSACANIIEDPIPSNTANNAGSSSVNETENTVVTTSADVPANPLIDEKIWKELENNERVKVTIIFKEPEKTIPEDSLEIAIEKINRGETPVIYDLKKLLAGSDIDTKSVTQQLISAQRQATSSLYQNYNNGLIERLNISDPSFISHYAPLIIAAISYDEALLLSQSKEVLQINYNSTEVIDDPDVPFYQTERYKELFSEAPDYCWYGFNCWITEFIIYYSPASLVYDLQPCEMIWYRVDAENVYKNPDDTVYGLVCKIGIKEKRSGTVEEGTPDEWIRFATPEEIELETENMKKQGFTILAESIADPFYLEDLDIEIPGSNTVLVLATLDTLLNYVPMSDNVFVAFENGAIDYRGGEYRVTQKNAYKAYLYEKNAGALIEQ